MRNSAALGFVHQRRSGRPQRLISGERRQVGERCLEVEVVRSGRDAAGALEPPKLRWKQAVDQFKREPAGGKTDFLVEVSVHNVIVAGTALHRARLATRDRKADAALQLQRDMFGDMAEPGSLAHAADEAAALAVAAAVLFQPGKTRDQGIREARKFARRKILQPAEI